MVRLIGKTGDEGESEDYSFAYAHGTVMILAWMVFASTGILFARYGRLLRIGKNHQLLGEAVWFQAHRLALTLASVATLLGFFLILVQEEGKWITVADDGPRVFAHSILGVIVICFAMFQVWIALFRCHPNSRFRFIYNWLHRTTGILAFILSIPTIFLIITYLSKYQGGLFAIISIWTAWVVLVVILFEVLEYRGRKLSHSSTDGSKSGTTNYELRQSDAAEREDRTVENENDQRDYYNRAKLILLGVHVLVAVALAIPFIVLIWKQA